MIARQRERHLYRRRGLDGQCPASFFLKLYSIPVIYGEPHVSEFPAWFCRSLIKKKNQLLESRFLQIVGSNAQFMIRPLLSQLIFGYFIALCKDPNLTVYG